MTVMQRLHKEIFVNLVNVDILALQLFDSKTLSYARHARLEQCLQFLFGFDIGLNDQDAIAIMV